MRLIGYVVGGERLDVDRLRSHLQQRVPEYMVPAALLQLDTLPLTPNGKVDRKALIELESKQAMETGSLTLTPTEELIAGVWSGLLGKPTIRRDDNFFDLGGHSLMVTQMLSRLKQVFNREIDLRAMFESPVLKDLSAYVDQLTGPAQLATLRPIVPTSRDADLPLSLQQEQLWFLEQITAGSTVYSLPATVRLKGDLDKLALRLSLEEIVRRHEVLRTSFVQVDSKPKQRIHEAGNFELVERDLRETANGVATEERINREVKEEAVVPFLLSQPELFRAKLLRVAEQEHILLLTFHHIVFDGWSIGVMVNELGQLYKAYHEGQSSPLPELPIQYADYTVWQRELMADGGFVDGLEYWKKELEDLSELDLPSDHPRPAVQSFRGTVERWEMSKEASAALRKVSQDQGVTLFMTLLAGFQILLARYSGQRDIVVGSPIANRVQPELEALIGFFVNTLVLRGNVNSDLTVEAALQRTREVCLGAYAHQSVPFEHLVDELQPERDLSRSPLFQVMLVLQNAPASALQMHGVEISMLPPATSGARFDLTLLVEDDPEHLQGMMEYCTDLYERPTVRRMLDHYQQVLSEMVRDPKQSVSTLPLLTEAERHRLLFDWNDTETVFASGCIHELFAEQVEKTPNAVAVEYEGREISYAELNRRANQLGRHLRGLGVGSEELIGILLPRCSELLVAMLGVLKTGAAYVLLDPDDRDQLAYILKDARPDVIVSEQRLSNKLPAHSGRTVYLDAQWNESSQESEQNVEAHVHPENLAYVTYRSEGTKAPEGVAVQHGNMASLVCWAQSVLSADDLPRVLTSNPPTSDLSILDTYVPLCSGGTVVVVDDSFDGVNLEEGNATLINATPSVMRELLRRKAVPPSVRTIMLAGEPVSSGLVRKIYDNCDVKRVLNLYGHSEISLASTITELQPGNEDQKVSIGRPVENTQAFVLDAHMELVSAGIVGELYLSAATSARGYFNRPDLTAECFVPNIFGSGGERLFRTGELARHKANGELELWGRVGHETRIRGHRVELEEVEKALERQPEVADAVVIVPQTGAAENKLVAYIVPQETGASAGDALERTLRVALKQRLPEYMVPSHWATLERLPLLPDGKLDRSALPPVQPKMEEAGSLTLTPTEELIAGVWSSLLGKSDIRRDDNFFDLGGHSLMVIQMLSRLRQVFNREIDLRAMFESLILKDLAAYVDQLTGSTQQTAAIPRVDRKGKLALSYGQERLWFIYQLEPENVAYNVPGAVRIQGPLDVESLERTLREIVRRHESLRTRFVSVVGEPQQIIDASVAVEVPVTELSHLAEPEREAEARRLALEEARQPFNLARGPLFRVKLLRLASQDHVLVFNMHHIVSDGWSVGVLVREVSAIYNNFSTGQPSSLPELDIQYADFSAWQREFLSGSLLEKQLEYWKQKLAAVEPLMLPTDRARTALQRPEGATTHFTVPVELTEALKTLSRKQGATLYMILLAAFQALLSRYSGQSDITVGSPIAGRSRTETEGLIGVFINTLVLRSDLSGQPDSIELLQRVKATTLEAFANQDVPFEKLVEVLLPQRDLTRSPLFQVLFVLQNVPRTVLQLGAAKMLAFDVDSAAAQFEISLVLAETDSGMEGVIVYNKGLFDAESVTRMIGHYQMLLNGIVAEPSQSIALLPLMTLQERKQVIEEWNRTEAQYPLDKCVHELFEEQVARTPQAVAVIYEEERLSYEELNARANRLAWYLRERGVGPDVLVGVFLERSLEMLVGLLGILKAGGCYLPLDPSFPTERLRYMVEDARPALLLTQERLEQRIVDAGALQTLCLDRDWETVGKRPETNLRPIGSGENLTYVIYTSGSTGRPKGVMVTRQALMNFLQSMTSIPGIEQSDVLAAVTTVSFDIAGLELYLPLINGGRILLLSRETARDAHELHQKLIQHSVTMMQATPSTWSMLLRDGWRPRSAFKILCGGEALNRDLATKLVGHDVPVWNLYGPTETTVWSCLKQLKSSESVTIGKPIANTQVYVVDEEMEPVPVGVSGELYIGGDGLARGYLNRPELTAERFVPDPFASKNTGGGGRLYRTGDLVRWQVDGNLEYLGRLDQQVKIRGFRIELEEIEAVLERHPSVARCVVLAREDQPGERRLVAYVVKKTGVPWPNASGLEEYLKVSLPEYMVPTVFVELEKLPLNHNGKIDRKALPQPDRDTPEEEYVGPRDATEETLCQLWQEVLRRERVGIHDDFFSMGGHSLLAVLIIARIKLAFAIEIPLSALFAGPTVAKMAKHIVAANGHEGPQSSPVLVSVQPQGSRAPFFCVHAVGGQVISYAELSQEMGLEQPFYGLQSPPANLFPESSISIEQMATLYNREIRSVQPVGPYLLSGWSMGGLVAWEMAQQLMKEGEAIRLLALIDTTPPSGYLEADDRDDEISMLARFALDMSRLVGKDPRPLVEQFLKAAEQDQWKMVQDTLTSYGVLAPKTAHAEMTALLDVYTRNFRAMKNYSIHTSKQAVVYFRASERPESISKPWITWAGGGIQFHVVPGDHYTILTRPNVRIIAEALQPYISANNSNEPEIVSPETSQYTF
ncbi:MAG: amino acid adenylation domain-containing protein [Candidatus Sulfotelmatobacter sp.]